MKTGLNHAVRVTVAALSIVLGLGTAVPAAAQCPGDLTGNGAIDGLDLAGVLSAWGTSGGELGGDVNSDGIVNGADLAVILSGWGPCSPVITSILPNTGPVSGGTSITITGNYFNGPISVTLGGVPAANVQVMSATSITALTPAVPAGDVDVSVSVSGRTATITNGFTFEQIEPGIVRAWGQNFYGECSVPNDLGLCIAVAGGDGHSVALRADGAVRAWGNNGQGQCNVPTDLGPCMAIAAGYYHTLALRTDGSVRAWGYNAFGQCDVPDALGACVSIAAGYHHTVVLRANGTVGAWGRNNSGQCNVPANLGICNQIGAGGNHSVASSLSNRSFRAWGQNERGQCNVPNQLCSAFACGYAFTVTVAIDGTVQSTGDCEYNQCGIPTDIGEVIALACGDYYSIALRSDGSLKSWGMNTAGSIIPTELAPCFFVDTGTYHTIVIQR